jgi:uncharacterized protein (UPF0210 family)
MAVVIRTITLGVGEPHPISAAALTRAQRILRAAQTQLQAAGYETQTLRVSTRPLFADRMNARDADIVAYAGQLQERCEELGLAYLSLGPAQADDPGFPLDRIKLLADMLVPNAALNATVQLASADHGLRVDAAVPAAKIVRALAQHTPQGLGNMRFAMVANCPQRGPFFPAAYQPDTTWGISVGLQSANLVRDALAEATRDSQPGPAALKLVQARLIGALEREGRAISEVVTRVAREQQVTFNGLDLSPAPNGEESIADAIAALGIGQFGEPGTLVGVAAITSALKQTSLATCGYNGIFLPVLEDAGIVRQLAARAITIPTLLLFSSVCGAGLDTVPIPGAAPIERIAATMLDVATLALRLNKPLSARLFPIPGKEVGEMTAFDSPWLTNAPVLAI